jgi:hypothetical protein
VHAGARETLLIYDAAKVPQCSVAIASTFEFRYTTAGCPQQGSD